MLISVIIPFKNSEKYIKQSVNSVINQSLSNKYYEIIAVNDRSRDTSNKIVKGIIHNKPNCKLLSTNRDTVGPGTARNLGIKYSSGQYIYFLDSDDFLRKQTLLRLKKVVDKNKHVDLICNDYKVFDRKKNMKKISRFDLDLLNKNKMEVLKNFFDLSIIPQVISNLIRRKLIIRNNIFFKEGYFEDVFFIFKVLAANNPLGDLFPKHISTYLSLYNYHFIYNLLNPKYFCNKFLASCIRFPFFPIIKPRR